ncbi:adenylyl-sulfate kinase [Niveispirillum lacus]|uniref:Multifunctional fusion protein n=1 Tax=Niveispirillum lacus TaxID=1981099 RepID=A0A255YQT4_9PROT|nr:sulfate adenylyltransferase subunit CysN [Niveispirillum lacus]OYQ31578.1 adenylyl-sulfate kinase [Niveispirillum lacus]
MAGLLHFITCGSVDDGKSSLIGRLLHDCGALAEDQLEALRRDSARHGTTGAGNLDMALLVDGLAAEREQGITIDVAYRYFGTTRRRFIVADTPGHEQYTRNMATGASTAELAVLLVDARKGLLAQTRRHSLILSLMGVRHVVLAVNKMDAVGWDEAVFTTLVDSYRAYAAPLGFRTVQAVPLSALTGDNVTIASDHMPWYQGPPLLELLETADTADGITEKPWRMPVQWVIRPDGDFRGLAGTITSGVVRVGDPVRVLPTGRESRVARIVTADTDLSEAQVGQAVTLVLADAVDVARGDTLCDPAQPPAVTDQFTAHVIWMHEQPLLPGRAYLLRLGTRQIGARITSLKHRIDIFTGDHLAAETLGLNDIGLCNLALDGPMPVEAYQDNRAGGAFILIDQHSNATLGCGMVVHTLRRADNIRWQPLKVDKAARTAQAGHRPVVLWFTGLSGAGKSTIADKLEQKLYAAGCRTMTLDGDNIRHGLCRDLGFTAADRVENIRRVGHVAQLMVDAGLVVLVSMISPYREDRDMARAMVGDGEFVEIFIDTPLAICEARDPKGLYAKARAGRLPNFTGLDSPYERPVTPDIHLTPADGDEETQASKIIEWLRYRGFFTLDSN